MTAVCVVAGMAAAALAGLRWLRVAQREHYLAGSASRFAARWWRLGPNRLLAVAALLGVALARRAPLAGAVGAMAVAAGPFGLSLRGRTAPLAWTRRLRTLAAVWAGLEALVLLAAALAGWAAAGAVLAAVAAPLLVDAACAVAAPLEDRLARRFVDQAARRLAEVGPTVVGVTGSYGKTGTKNAIAHLVAGSMQVVATPRSFNNRAGLARAVNEGLVPGTDVFVAEMGTYGPGEIAELVRWCPPDIAVITAIGPVHLERMRSEEVVLRAKSEILEPASVVVLNVDDGRLAELAGQVSAMGKRVVCCSARDRTADVAVVGAAVFLHGERAAAVGELSAPPTNVACAVAVAVELGVSPESLAARLSSLPATEHRQTVTVGSGGFTIVDDTYNANPAGAARALQILAAHAGPGGRQVVVTPGMVELGPRQPEENERFAAAVAATGARLVVVGHTNRVALLRGGAEAITVETREDAVAWVRTNLGPGDAVLYENDLPDHYP